MWRKRGDTCTTAVRWLPRRSAIEMLHVSVAHDVCCLSSPELWRCLDNGNTHLSSIYLIQMQDVGALRTRHLHNELSANVGPLVLCYKIRFLIKCILIIQKHISDSHCVDYADFFFVSQSDNWQVTYWHIFSALNWLKTFVSIVCFLSEIILSHFMFL